MKYQVAERFHSVQGEGIYAGVPMAFIRFVGCSVGKRICQHCDTDFDNPFPWMGGGEYTETELGVFVGQHQHVCLTGGEPLDQELFHLNAHLHRLGKTVHVETSGTVLYHVDRHERIDHICVSPKPGWQSEMIDLADEIKVIVPGLGINPPTGTRWPDINDARFWARKKIVYLQPRNGKFDVEMNNLRLCEQLVQQYPELRLSVQLHKILRAR